MSVSVDTNYFRRSFAGYEHPSLPEGYWTASSSVTGDASGDFKQIRVLLQTADQSRSGNMFSLEQVVMTNDGQAARPMIIQTENMDTIGSLVGQFSVTQSLAQVGGKGAAIVSLLKLAFPAWLGAPFAEGEATVIFAIDNVNGEELAVFAQGFIWGPRSIMAAGGPQRPATSIYG